MNSFLKHVVVTGGFVTLALGLVQWQNASAYGPLPVPGVSKRVQQLEDIEAIKTLKYEYMIAVDDVIADPCASQDFVDLFANNFTVEFDQFGTYSNKADLKAFLENVISPAYSWAFHMAENPRIEVHGNWAVAEWYLRSDAVVEGTTDVLAFYGRYVDTYVRTNQGWRISSTVLTYDPPPAPLPG